MRANIKNDIFASGAQHKHSVHSRARATTGGISVQRQEQAGDERYGTDLHVGMHQHGGSPHRTRRSS